MPAPSWKLNSSSTSPLAYPSASKPCRSTSPRAASHPTGAGAAAGARGASWRYHRGRHLQRQLSAEHAVVTDGVWSPPLGPAVAGALARGGEERVELPRNGVRLRLLHSAHKRERALQRAFDCRCRAR